MSGAGCNCNGGPAHAPTCPLYTQVVGPDGASALGDGCRASDPVHAPVLGIACGLGVRVLAVSDLAGKIVSRLGLRPYRVFLVWEERGPDGEYHEVRKTELMPAEVVDMKGVSLDVGAAGTNPEGEVRIQRISPLQVTEDALMGMLDGRTWNGDGQRFFYEVVRHRLCESEQAPTRWRFTPKSVPHLSATKAPLGYSITLVDQSMQRDPQGRDQTVKVGEQPVGSWLSKVRS
ncbi:MAG TPA: hypothetical protein PKA64_05970 [Myxococcota bacterium]|nr:hypothetical protein [Myxococcota bacterium]